MGSNEIAVTVPVAGDSLPALPVTSMLSLEARTRLAADAELERLYALHSKRVLAYCRRQLGGRGEAEDATQTVFLHALRGLRRGVVPETEAAWLFTIAHNVCRTYWRSSLRRRRAEEQRDPHVLQEIAPGREADHDELFGLDDALARIPGTQRQALLLREWHGLSHREIADRMGTTQTAAEMLLFRARRSLAAELRGERTVELRRPVAALGELLSNLKVALGGSATAKIAVSGAMLVAVLAGGSGLLHRHRPAPAHARPAATAPVAHRVAAPDGSPARAAHAAQPRRPRITGWPERRRGIPARTIAPRVTARPGPSLAPISSGPASSGAQRPATPAASGSPPSAQASTPAPPPSGSSQATLQAPDVPTTPDVPSAPQVPSAPAVPAPDVPDAPAPPPTPELPPVPDLPAPPRLPY
jgi:RNA polymerase sigma factor (sigma-70 family)